MSTTSIILVLAAIIITVIFVTRFLSYRRKKHLETVEKLEWLLVGIRKFDAEIERNRKKYFRHSQMLVIKSKYAKLHDEIDIHFRSNLISSNSQVIAFIDTYKNVEDRVKEWNKDFVARECVVQKRFLSNIAGKSLDQQQRESVVSDEDNSLVVAGAGSGKTLTIVAKVKYLVKKKNISPGEILLVAFTRKAAEELRERLKHELKSDIVATTFHAMGMSIIKKALKERPDVFDGLSDVIGEYFKNDLIKDKSACEKILHFFAYMVNIPIDLETIDNKGQAIDHYRQMDLETLKSKILKSELPEEEPHKTFKGETVKSIEEWQIANFLFLHNIKYEYEKLYPLKYKGADKYRKRYRPDFYLPEYNIWLEHFGISEDGRAKWLSPVEEEKYIESMHWKRKVHNKYGTKLIESYSYNFNHGLLTDYLEDILKSNEVKIGSVDKLQLYEALYLKDTDRYFKEFRKLIASFINLFKSNGHDEDYFVTLVHKAMVLEHPFIRERALCFLKIVRPIFKKYQEKLRTEVAIDFNDMISKATKIVQSKKYHSMYKYIIIDEYQDISMSRFKLIQALRGSPKTATYCVGDDFQSIYRFTGSDVALFTDFQKYIGFTLQSKIEKTYRNSQELVDIAGKFIMKNKQQIPKTLVSDKSILDPIKILEYASDSGAAFCTALDKIALEVGDGAEVMVIGRNNFDVENLQKEQDHGIKIVSTKDNIRLIYKKFPKLKISYLTAHKSKGLESDNVVVINLQNKLLGFPNKISDDPVLGLLRDVHEDYEFAEERRLFYVAITRTRNRCFLISSEATRSIFIKELIKEHQLQPEFSTDEISLSENPKCPLCQEGYLVLRKSEGRGFVGCTNFPYCEYTNSNTDVLLTKKICDKCGGIMIKRKKSSDVFLGCTNYPKCKNTEKCVN